MLSYHPRNQYFNMCVLVNETEDKKYLNYLSKIVIRKQNDAFRKISYQSPVLSIKSYRSEFHLNHISLPYETIKSFMNCKIIDNSYGLIVDSVTLCIEVEIIKRKIK